LPPLTQFQAGPKGPLLHLALVTMPSALPDPDSAVADVRRANGGYLIVDLDAADAHSIHSMLEGSTTFFASSDNVKSKAKGTSKFGYKVRAVASRSRGHTC